MEARSIKHWLSAAALAAGGFVAPLAMAGSYSHIVVFGDSVSDSGNVALAIGQPSGVPQTVSGNGYIPDYPYYPTGRFSNGPVWAEDFAALYGLGAVPSLLGGTDFAFAGARTGGPDVPVPTLTSQGQLFLGGSGTAPSDALYVIAEVGNDARDALAAIAGGADVPSTLAAAAAAYAANLGQLVDTLRAAGATQFLVFDNVDLGLVPAVRAMGSDAAGLATFITASMNQALRARLHDEAGVSIFDTFGFLGRVVQDPGAFGFSNATDACAAVPGADCSTYVFWDGLHPTAAMHEQIAMAAVPESRSVLLFAAGLAVLVVVRRHRPSGL